MAFVWKRDFVSLAIFVFDALIVIIGLLALAAPQILAIVVGKAHTSRITSCALASYRAGKTRSAQHEIGKYDRCSSDRK